MRKGECLYLVVTCSSYVLTLPGIFVYFKEFQIQSKVITKTCPCNIQRFFSAVKPENFTRKKLIFLIFLLKTLIVGTPRQNRLAEAVLTSTHNLYFGAKIRKKVYPCIPQFYYIKVGFKGVYISRTCFPDESKHGHSVSD